MNMLIGLPVPENIKVALRKAMEQFDKYIDEPVNEIGWQISLLRMKKLKGDSEKLCDIAQAMPQAFLPTVNITHVGRGQQSLQLWAFVNQTKVLAVLQEQISERYSQHIKVVSIVPHLVMATLKKETRDVMLADWPINVSYSVSRINLYQDATDVAATIDLSP